MRKVSFVFRDGDRTAVSVGDGETILAAARRQGLRLASDCEVGDCQTCRAQVVDGQVGYEAGTSVSLSPEQMHAGEVLTCVAGARSDVTLSLPYARGELIQPKPFTMAIEAVTRLSASVVQVKARTQGFKPVDFLPGQYVKLRVPGTEQWRSYSMANAPGADRTFEFLVRLLDEGAMSRFLREGATAGDKIAAQGPYGTFYLRAGERRLTMIAGGTGLAPFAAMLRHLRARKDPRKVQLFFGVNTEADLFYLNDLHSLGSDLPGLDVHVAIVAGSAMEGTHNGFVTDILSPTALAGSDVYLCGPPPMVDSGKAAAASHGASAIFTEEFTPS